MGENRVMRDERIPRIERETSIRKPNKRLIMLIFIFFMLIMIIIYFQSPLSKLSQVEVEGNHLMTTDRILALANLELGMFYFSFSKRDIEIGLKRNLEIKSVLVERIFPNKLKITIEEYPIVSFWMEENQLFPIISNGYILMNRPWEERVHHPILHDWPTKDGLDELAKEMEKLPISVRNRMSEIRLTPIVSDPYRLVIYMMDGYEVRTSIRNFAENMAWYPHYVQLAQQEGEEGGIFYLLDGKWYINPSTTDHDQGREGAEE